MANFEKSVQTSVGDFREEKKFDLERNITNNCTKEPVTLILFPPSNKTFKFNAQTNCIQVEALSMQTEQGGITIEERSIDNFRCEQPSDIERFSGLTPLIEGCNISEAESLLDSLNDSELRKVIENTNGNASQDSSGKFPFKTLSNSLCNYNAKETNNTLEISPKNEKIMKDQKHVREILRIQKIFDETKLGKNCFLKGCKWSPDGLCLLSNSEDNTLRLFDVPENLISHPKNDIIPALQVKEGGTIYDMLWYPQMNSMNPISCVFASASQNAPIHLWDAYTGALRATYQPINQIDEVIPAYSLAFSPDGSKLYSGFKKHIRIFDVSQPGRMSEERKLKVTGSTTFQTNIVSSICINPNMQNIYVLGTYDKTLGIYAEPEGKLLFILKGHSGGITHTKFASNGYHLFSGGRKDPEILCWDIRNPGKVLFCLQRAVDTHQKIMFDLSPDEIYLATGTTNCEIKIYNLRNPPNAYNVLEPVNWWMGHADCVNSVQFHETLDVLASASGQRHFSSSYADDDDDVLHDFAIDNSLKIWSLKNYL